MVYVRVLSRDCPLHLSSVLSWILVCLGYGSSKSGSIQNPSSQAPYWRQLWFISGRWSLANELGLVVVALYQKSLQLQYVEGLVENIKRVRGWCGRNVFLIPLPKAK